MSSVCDNSWKPKVSLSVPVSHCFLVFFTVSWCFTLFFKLFSITAADRINAPSKHFTLTVGDRELLAQNVILIVQINTHIMTVILRYCGPFYDSPMHTLMYTEVTALVLELAKMARSWRD